MPAAAIPIIAAGIGAGGSLASGLIGRSAASSAADKQVAAAQQAQKTISDLLNQYNPPIGQAAQTAANLSTQAGADAVQQIRDTLAQNRQDVLAGLPQANQLLAPYVGLGSQSAQTLASLMAPGGDLNRTFNYQDIQQLDPGYQFRMDQASKALQASAAARGGALGGGTLAALSNLNQNMASQEAQNAFTRLTQSQQDRFNRLNALVGTGYQASNVTGQNILGANQFLANQGLSGAQNIGQWMIQPAQYAGTALAGGAEQQANNAMAAGRSIAELMTGAGNAAASGIMGGAQSMAGALAGVTNSAGGLLNYYQNQNMLNQLQNIFNNPAVTPPFLGPDGYVIGTPR